MKTVTLGDIFTTAQLERAQLIYDAAKAARRDHTAADLITRTVTEPALAQINERTGQENDPRYWAYAIIYAIEQRNR